VCRCIRSKFDCQLNEHACAGKNKERGHDESDGTAVVRCMVLPRRLRPHFSLLSVGELAISCSSCIWRAVSSFSSSLEGSKSRRISSNVVFAIMFWRQAPPSSRWPIFWRLDSEDERLRGPPSLCVRSS